MTAEAAAVPEIGPPFFVADPRTDGDTFPALSTTENGIVVGWVAEGETAFRRLDPDGHLGASESVVFEPYRSDQLGAHSATAAVAPIERMARVTWRFGPKGRSSS